MTKPEACIFAPASVGNVGVGFDIMGLAIAGVGDRVTAMRTDEPGLRLGQVSGVVRSLPESVDDNTALRAARAVLKTGGVEFGVRLDVEKGAPLSAGMGGSASSAVAAAAAVNALLPDPVSAEALFACAIEGERASSDPPPLDNVAASLFGGLAIIAPGAAVRVIRAPAPANVVCIVAHPDFQIETRAARHRLSAQVPLATAVAHSGHLAAFVAGCYAGDEDLIARGLRDVLVEPQRRDLAPYFDVVQNAALAGGALGCSFSGSGPSMFAMCRVADAPGVGEAMETAFQDQGLACRLYETPLDAPGALDPCTM